VTSKRGIHLIAALATALLISACSGSGSGSGSGTGTSSRHGTDGRASRWDAKAGPAEVSAFMHVAVPAGAAEAKGAVQINPREDVYLLSFVTSEKNAEKIAKDLRSGDPLKAQKAKFAPEGERFRHLGLVEPQTLKGVRWAGVCPPCVKDDRRRKMQWIEIYVEALKDDRARVYLQAF